MVKIKITNGFFKIKLASACLFGSLLVWLGFVTLSDFYQIQLKTSKKQPFSEFVFNYGQPKPLNGYLRTVNRREMFKQSVLYKTKEREVVDILGKLVFLGVIKTGGSARAFIQNIGTGQSTLFSEGEQIGDIKIIAIKDDRLILNHGDETLELLK